MLSTRIQHDSLIIDIVSKPRRGQLFPFRDMPNVKAWGLEGLR